MYRNYGYDYGYGCGAEPILPAALTSVSPVPSITPLPNHPSNITSPAIPGIAPGPGPSVPGVHHGMQYGMVCVPVAFYPFDF